MTLLEECLEALKDKYILNEFEKKFVEEKFYNSVPLSRWGRVEWSKFNKKKSIKTAKELLSICKNKEYYIIWSDPTEPIIKCNLDSIIKNIDDVTAVSFDTWLLSIDIKEVVEFYHESEITWSIIEN